MVSKYWYISCQYLMSFKRQRQVNIFIAASGWVHVAGDNFHSGCTYEIEATSACAIRGEQQGGLILWPPKLVQPVARVFGQSPDTGIATVIQIGSPTDFNKSMKGIRIEDKIVINFNKVIGGKPGGDVPDPIGNLKGEAIVSVVTVNAQLTGLFVKSAFDIS